MRIAILEDDPDQLALLKRWLADAGHDVHAYTSGRDIMRLAGRESFDAYVLDWQVPDVSGADVLEKQACDRAAAEDCNPHDFCPPIKRCILPHTHRQSP